MVQKKISLPEPVYARLKARKKLGESFPDLILRLLDTRDPHSRERRDRQVASPLTDSDILDLLDELTTYLSKYPPPNLTFKKVVIRDEGHFEVLAMGWRGSQRIHTPVLHLEYKVQKILVHYNGTDLDLEEWLLERGINKRQIIPAHLPPEELALLEQYADT